MHIYISRTLFPNSFDNRDSEERDLENYMEQRNAIAAGMLLKIVY